MRRDFARRYAIGLVAAIGAAAVRVALLPLLGTRPPYITFYLGTVIAAAYGGMGPGMLVIVIGMAFGLAVLPGGPVDLAQEATRLGLFTLSGFGICLIAEGMHRQRRRVLEQAQDLQRVVRMLDLANVFVHDASGTIIRWNSGCCRLYGYRAEEAVGRVSHELLQTRFPEPLEQIRAKVLSEGSWHGDLIHTAADGREVVVRCEWVVHRETAEEGFSIIEVDTDITERKQAEDALRTSEERFRALVTASSEVIYRMSPDWKEMRQLYSDNFLANTEAPNTEWMQEYIHPADQPRVAASIEEAIRTKSTFELKHRVRRSDGALGWTFSRAVPLMDRSGNIVEWFGAATDITERVRAEEEIARLNAELAERAADLEESNRELEAFNYSVAHDLRQPLNVIFGNYQAIRNLCGDRLDQQCAAFLENAYKGIDRMNGLIETLLRFSRLSKVELKREPVDLSAMARNVAKELKLTAPQREVEFKISDGTMVNGDPDLLRIMLDNLLGNAWKFTDAKEGAIITFGVAEADGKTACFVRDNGPGFEMSEADTIFTPFARLPKTERHRGFGIGLATVQRIIVRHGGRIWAEGEPGKGATFYFTLPLAAEVD